MNSPGYRSAQDYCHWANGQMERDDLMWIVGPNGTPILVDDESVCLSRAKQAKASMDAESRRQNHRIMNPIVKENGNEK